MTHYIIAVRRGWKVAGECGLYADKEGPSPTVTECHIKLDALWQRVIMNPSVAERVGTFSHKQRDHRGFCVDNTQKNFKKQLELIYER